MTQQRESKGVGVPEETVATVHRLLATALADARTGGTQAMMQGEVFQQVLAELSKLDPAVQRKAARAMVSSGGDPDAVRAVLGEGVAEACADAAPRGPVAARVPTVVDARGGFPWLGLLFAIVIAATATAAWFVDR